MVSVCKDGDVQAFVASGLGGAHAGLLLNVMQACPVEKMPAVWVDAVRTQLASPDEAVRARAMRLVAARRIEPLAGGLARIAADASVSPAQRLEALDALVLVRPALDPPVFAWLTSQLDRHLPAPVRQQAAGILAQAWPHRCAAGGLAESQVATADTFVLPRIVTAFDRGTSAAVGTALVRALERSTDRLDVLSEHDLAARLAKFPEPVPTSAAPLMLALRQRQNARLKRLESIDAGLGRAATSTQDDASSSERRRARPVMPLASKARRSGPTSATSARSAPATTSSRRSCTRAQALPASTRPGAYARRRARTPA